MSATPGSRPCRTRSTSSCSRASTSGDWLTRYQVHVSAFAVVSWPARKIVIASSRTCRSVIVLPSSSSCATSSIDSRSRSEEHTSELQSQSNLVCRLLLEKKKKKKNKINRKQQNK